MTPKISVLCSDGTWWGLVAFSLNTMNLGKKSVVLMRKEVTLVPNTRGFTMETDLVTAMSIPEVSFHVPLCKFIPLLCFVNIPDLWNFVERAHIVSSESLYP